MSTTAPRGNAQASKDAALSGASKSADVGYWGVLWAVDRLTDSIVWVIRMLRELIVLLHIAASFLYLNVTHWLRYCFHYVQSAFSITMLAVAHRNEMLPHLPALLPHVPFIVPRIPALAPHAKDLVPPMMPHMHVIVPYMPVLLPHFDELEPYLGVLAPTVPGMLPHLPVLLPHFERFMPYIPRIMPHFPLLAPHVEQLMPYVDALAPDIDKFMPHMDIMMPHLEKVLPYLGDVVPYVDVMLPYMDDIAPYMDDLAPHLDTMMPHMPILLPHLDKMLPYIVPQLGQLAPMMDKLMPHMEALLPHMDKLLPHLDKLLPHLDKILPHMTVFINQLDSLPPLPGSVMRIFSRGSQLFKQPNFFKFGRRATSGPLERHEGKQRGSMIAQSILEREKEFEEGEPGPESLQQGINEWVEEAVRASAANGQIGENELSPPRDVDVQYRRSQSCNVLSRHSDSQALLETRAELVAQPQPAQAPQQAQTQTQAQSKQPKAPALRRRLTNASARMKQLLQRSSDGQMQGNAAGSQAAAPGTTRDDLLEEVLSLPPTPSELTAMGS